MDPVGFPCKARCGAAVFTEAAGVSKHRHRFPNMVSGGCRGAERDGDRWRGPRGVGVSCPVCDRSSSCAVRNLRRALAHGAPTHRPITAFAAAAMTTSSCVVA